MTLAGVFVCRVDQVVGGIKGKAVVAGLGQAAKGVVAVVDGLLCTAAEQLTFGVVLFCQLS